MITLTREALVISGEPNHINVSPYWVSFTTDEGDGKIKIPTWMLMELYDLAFWDFKRRNPGYTQEAFDDILMDIKARDKVGL